jgi:D-sedoheptulose 7-phosphate isomerase
VNEVGGKQETLVAEHLLASADYKRAVVGTCAQPATEAAARIAEAFRAGGKLLICGNGGSAADSQHLAAEFVGRLNRGDDRRALPALALTTDTSFLTAHANDVDFDSVFERQIEALGRAGDVLLVITTSGASPNVLRAVTTGRARSITTVALTGEGPVARMVDLAIVLPGSKTQLIQEAMLSIEHSICQLVERLLFGSGI